MKLSFVQGLVWLFLIAGAAVGDERDVLTWSSLPTLPDTIGYAGPFAGVSGEALIVAGGANFPNRPPWEDGAKKWSAASYVLPHPESDWVTANPLPRPLGYGVSITWGGRVFCLGGGDAERHYRDALALHWNGETLRVDENALPELPRPCALGAGVVADNVIYLAGGIERSDASQAMRQFWSLDLSQPPRQRRWRELPPCPGEGRILPVMAALAGKIYLVSGAELYQDESGGVARRYLHDAYEYDPSRGEWRRLADAPRPMVAAPSPAMPLGYAHLAFLSGDDGRHNGQPELEDEHPGFPPEIFLYHTVTDTWRQAGSFPKRTPGDSRKSGSAGSWPPVTTPMVAWRGRFVLPSGEIRPGVRTPNVIWASLAHQAGVFGWLNWSVLAGYLAMLVGIGYLFSGREQGTSDFFLGGRRVPWWAAGLSIYGTTLSAITFLSIPARTYATDWALILMNAGILVVAPVVVFWYLPFFRRLQITTAFEYLEQRFSLGLRMFGSTAFVVFQLGRMSIVILLPAMAISAVIGLDIWLCIVLMGVLSTLYTTMGGIEAVIWTDVLQVIVLMAGALTAILLVITRLDGGLPQMLDLAADYDKFTVAHLSWGWTGDALWIVVLGAIFSNNLVPYTTDQAVVQRYLTTPTEGQAARAVWTNALIAIPSSLLFFSLGTALFVFYHTNPAALRPLDSPDQIFPWFIATQLPTGLSGLVIAGVFAAAMSSLDSSMHSISTVITTDFVRRFRIAGSDESYLNLARGLTIFLGALGTLAAFWMSQVEVLYLWDMFLGILGLLGGTSAGLFCVGVFMPRVRPLHAWLAVLASIASLLAVKYFTDASALLYGAVGVGVCVLVAGITSRILPASGGNSSLTVFSMPLREDAPHAPQESQHAPTFAGQDAGGQ